MIVAEIKMTGEGCAPWIADAYRVDGRFLILTNARSWLGPFGWRETHDEIILPSRRVSIVRPATDHELQLAAEPLQPIRMAIVPAARHRGLRAAA